MPATIMPWSRRLLQSCRLCYRQVPTRLVMVDQPDSSLAFVFPPEPRECKGELLYILPADLASGEIARPRVSRRRPIVCVDVGVRVPFRIWSDRLGKVGNLRCGSCRRPGDQIRLGQGACHRP